MKIKFIKLTTTIAISTSLLLSSCARDLSSNVYSSSSTLSLTLEGNIVSTRPIVIKENENLGDNVAGGIGGGAMGAALGSTVGNNGGKTVAVVGGALAGAVAGAAIQGALGKSEGFEYIVKVDTKGLNNFDYEGSAAMRDAVSAAKTNGLVTIVQGKDVVLAQGQKVYVIFSDKRTRIIPRS